MRLRHQGLVRNSFSWNFLATRAVSPALEGLSFRRAASPREEPAFPRSPTVLCHSDARPHRARNLLFPAVPLSFVIPTRGLTAQGTCFSPQSHCPLSFRRAALPRKEPAFPRSPTVLCHSDARP